MPELTNKQKAFVDEYQIDLNATQAAIRAGYKPDYASEQGYQLIQKTTVKEAIDRALAERAKRAEISADYVLVTIQDTIERCRQMRPVLDKAGNPVMCETEDGQMALAFVFDAGNVLRGTEQLGRHLKMFTDKREVDTNFNVTISPKDAELL